MICSHCGSVYPDDMTECPNCHTVNDDVEAQVMSDAERDSFQGVTINTDSPDSDRFTVQNENQSSKEGAGKWAQIVDNLLSHYGWILRIIVVTLVVIGALFFLLPVFGLVIFIGIIVLGLNFLLSN
jgi:hypothetical protein